MLQRLCIGEENFKTLRSNNYAYVDKTCFIKNLFGYLDEDENNDGSLYRTGSSNVTLITRPRRFGKTLTLSMLRYFLELNYQNPGDKSEAEKLFQGLEISKSENQSFCRQYMSEYPVILISLKGISGNTYTKALRIFLTKINELYKEFEFILNSEALSESEKKEFQFISNFTSSSDLRLSDPDNECNAEDIVLKSLKTLARILNEVYKRRTIILIDEYDVPLQKAQVNGYYDKMLTVIRGFFENALKTNINLEKGIVTGCLRISHESIFTGVNNFVTRTINDLPLRDFIGFTKDEVHNLLQQCNLGAYEDEVVRWYDGYRFCNTDILCPWSILNFCAEGMDCLRSNEEVWLKNYWANSSGNDIIEMCIKHTNDTDSLRLQNLLDGKAEVIEASDFTTYPDMKDCNDIEVVLNLMLHTGYLTVDHIPEKGKLAVRIPNLEIRSCFEDKVTKIFSKYNSEWHNKAIQLREAFFANKQETAENIINDMLSTFLSIRNTAQESYYHAFLSGVLAIASGSGYKLESDTESGDGYADLRMEMLGRNKKVVIIECKKITDDDDFTEFCHKALQQIEEKKYALPYEKRNYQILKYGISFCGKYCGVVGE
ncbi:MAG: AAA family ATPase [Succinivibrionaceae bacterium]